MSWYGYSSTESVDMKASGVIKITWTCQRCYHTQTTKVGANTLLHGHELKCKNTKVCGEGQSYFGLGLEVANGLYKGTADLPLNKKG